MAVLKSLACNSLFTIMTSPVIDTISPSSLKKKDKLINAYLMVDLFNT